MNDFYAKPLHIKPPHAFHHKLHPAKFYSTLHKCCLLRIHLIERIQWSIIRIELCYIFGFYVFRNIIRQSPFAIKSIDVCQSFRIPFLHGISLYTVKQHLIFSKNGNHGIQITSRCIDAYLLEILLPFEHGNRITFICLPLLKYIRPGQTYRIYLGTTK